MLVTKLEIDFQNINDKGLLVQLVHCGWTQFNIIKSLKGSNRGGHYHKENMEAFYIVEGSVTLRLQYKEEEEITCFSEGDFFLIKPNQKHWFEFNEKTIMVSMYDIGVERRDGSKDIYVD